jgi:protoheme IX farnesyltransferase
MWYDADIDSVMRRTALRPIPTGRVSPREALVFGLVLAIGSVAVCAWRLNPMSSAILALTIGFYIFVYTVALKRRTPYNIVIGGAAGAFPPMIGWAAATGEVSLGSLSLFLIIFLWTPPHFWALALFRSGDYERAGVPMLPVVAGVDETSRQVLLYTVLLVASSFVPVALGFEGPFYAAVAAVLGARFLQRAYELRHAALGMHDKAAKRVFGFSIAYLFLLFVALVLGVR